MGGMRWLLAGASGFLGNALRVRLASEGHEVVRLVRREPATSTEFRWDPYAGEVDPAAFEGVDAVVNLAGVERLHPAVDDLAPRGDRRLPGRRPPARWPGPWPSGRPRTASGRSSWPRAPPATTARCPAIGPTPRTPPPAPDFARPGLRRSGRRAAQIAADAGVRVVVLRTSPGARPQRRLVPADAAGLVLRSGCQARRRPAQWMPMITLDGLSRRGAAGRPTTPQPPDRTT